jgi:hypothetical protein
MDCGARETLQCAPSKIGSAAEIALYRALAVMVRSELVKDARIIWRQPNTAAL